MIVHSFAGAWRAAWLRALAGLAALWLAALWLAVAAAPAQAVDYGRDQAFTLYAADGVTAAAFKQDVILVLHGFASAMPNRTYKILHKAFGKSHTVLGFNYDYLDVAANRAELQELYDRFLAGRTLIVVGTSLGGFWADYFANQVGARGAILVNPVVDPQALLRDMQGEHYSERRQKSFQVTDADADAYATLRSDPNPRTDVLVLLTRDDDLLPYEEAVEAYAARARAETAIFELGGHSPPLDRPDILAVIRQFVEEATAP